MYFKISDEKNDILQRKAHPSCYDVNSSLKHHASTMRININIILKMSFIHKCSLKNRPESCHPDVNGTICHPFSIVLFEPLLKEMS